MKTIVNSWQRTNHGWFKVVIALFTYLSFLVTPSCQKDELDQESLDMEGMEFTALALSPSADLYYGPETFYSVFKQTVIETRDLSNQNFKYFENFILKVQNGNSNKTKVSKVEIRIDGVLIVSSADFRKKVNYVEKPLSALTATSELEVKLEGPKGSFISLFIERTIQEDVITDIEGNYYHTVQIGNQRWMAENLKTTKFSNGDAIPNVTSDAAWSALSTPAYCYYNNDINYKPTYGTMYNWYTVDASSNGDKNVCPTGWRVPSDAGLTILEDFLGGLTVAGGKLKETGTIHWDSPNTGATNETGFTALPSGFRSSNGLFYSIRSSGY